MNKLSPTNDELLVCIALCRRVTLNSFVLSIFKPSTGCKLIKQTELLSHGGRYIYYLSGSYVFASEILKKKTHWYACMHYACMLLTIHKYRYEPWISMPAGLSPFLLRYSLLPEPYTWNKENSPHFFRAKVGMGIYT